MMRDLPTGLRGRVVLGVLRHTCRQLLEQLAAGAPVCYVTSGTLNLKGFPLPAQQVLGQGVQPGHSLPSVGGSLAGSSKRLVGLGAQRGACWLASRL